MSLTDLRARAVRARIADACAPPMVPAELGTIRLRDHQRASAARVVAALARDGGCLLADDVGRGKTYVALAVVRGWERPLVVVPASLRSTWDDAMRRAGVSCPIATHESLSRGRLPHMRPDGIVVDESHRFRSTSARRHAALATLAASARLLLLSATPLQNRARDLAAQIALFHGSRAFGLDARALAAFVVRGSAAAHDGMPVVAPPAWVAPVADDGAVLEALLALPAPARPRDAGDAGVLRTIGLVRAWASSRAALTESLRRRRRVATAMEQSAAEGLVPTRRELRAWPGADDAVQLGFAPMLASGGAVAGEATALLRAVSDEHDALGRLRDVMAASGDPDAARVRALRVIRAAHAGERVLAFTELASTARMYWSRLRSEPGLGLLTAREARIASGPLPRDALLERFAPRARGVPAPPERERVTLLIATDLLSEGVNLQDASVVVHLDLPWNPARLAQRVGRVRRPGGAAVVRAYLVAPPARADLLLDVERRLRRKLAESAAAIGRGIDVVPALASVPVWEASDVGHAAALGEIASCIAGWRRATARRRGVGRRGEPALAAVESVATGWFAALDDGRLLASVGGAPPDGGDAVRRLVLLCDGPGRPLGATERRECLDACERWLGAEALARDCGQGVEPCALAAAVDRQIARTLQRVPRHRRGEVAAGAAELRAALGSAWPLGAERALRDLLAESGDDRSEWVRNALELARAVPRRSASPSSHASPVALLALGPHEAPRAPSP